MSIDEFMNALEPGDAWLRVAPIDKGWRQERVRVALPRRSASSGNDSVNTSVAGDARSSPTRIDRVVSWT